MIPQHRISKTTNSRIIWSAAAPLPLFSVARATLYLARFDKRHVLYDAACRK
jgi:hypothetical protein